MPENVVLTRLVVGFEYGSVTRVGVSEIVVLIRLVVVGCEYGWVTIITLDSVSENVVRTRLVVGLSVVVG